MVEVQTERLIQIPSVLTEQDQKGQFIPAMVHLHIGAFDAYISAVPINIQHTGFETSPTKANNLRTFLNEEEFTEFTARVASETKRSMAKVMIPDSSLDQSSIPYDDQVKVPAPFTMDDINKRRQAVEGIISEYKDTLRPTMSEEQITALFSAHIVDANTYRNYLRLRYTEMLKEEDEDKIGDTVNELINKEMNKKENGRQKLIGDYATYLIEKKGISAHAVNALTQPERMLQNIEDYKRWLRMQGKTEEYIESNVIRVTNMFIIPPQIPKELSTLIIETIQLESSITEVYGYTESQREGYKDNAVRTIKYALTGSGPNNALIAQFDQEDSTMIVQVLTGKRPYFAYRLFAHTPLTESHAQEKRNLARIIGTVSSLRTRDGKRIITKRSDDNDFYKSLGLRGGLCDIQVGEYALIPFSNAVVERNNNEETQHESGIPSHVVIERQITTIGYDNEEDHMEVGEAAIIDMDAKDLIQVMLENGVKGEKRVNEFPEMSFFVMDDSSDALADLLTRVHSGFPPTHVLTLLGDVFVMRYNERLAFYGNRADAQQLAYIDAREFVELLAPQIEQNNAETDAIAAKAWTRQNAWEEFIIWEQDYYKEKGKKWITRQNTPPNKYDPSIPDRFQGIFPREEIEKFVRSHTPIVFYGPDFNNDNPTV